MKAARGREEGEGCGGGLRRPLGRSWEEAGGSRERSSEPLRHRQISNHSTE